MWLISSAQGSRRSRLGLKRLPAVSASARKPAIEPGAEAGAAELFVVRRTRLGDSVA